MLVIPGAIIAPDHAAPLPRDPARRHLAAVVEGRRGRRAGGGRRRRRGAGADAAGPRSLSREGASNGRGPEGEAVRTDESAGGFARYKEDVKERGKPFYPYAMFHDTIMSLVVVVAIIGLAVIWKWSAYGPHHDPIAQGAARAGAVDRAGRPGHDELRAAAGLVLLLPLLPAPDLQVAGVGLPRHGRRADDRAHPADRRCRSSTAAACAGRLRRPVAMVAAVLDDHLDGRADVEGRDGEGGARLGGDPGRAALGRRTSTCRRTRSPGRSSSPSAGCTACHTYDGVGGSNLARRT